VRVILIGGTSGVGKTTTARSLAARLGWEHVSTDRMARHPGRPWTDSPYDPVPEHVLAHYRMLSVDQLVAEQLRHYERLWPTVAELATTHATDPAAARLIIEGSGILPDGVAALDAREIAAVWLTAEPALLSARIREVSRFDEAPEVERALVRAFTGRTLGYERIVMAAVRHHRFPVVAVRPDTTVEALVDRCIALT
jgi:2-phosphoglycerate kinase